MHSTLRQINAAVANALRLRDIRPDEAPQLRAKLAEYSMADIDKLIKSQNVRTGWTPNKPASDAQRRYLAVLEKKVTGSISTMPGKSLTAKEASEQIAYLSEVAKQIDAQVEAAGEFTRDAIGVTF